MVKKTEKFFDELKKIKTDDLEIMTSLYHIQLLGPEMKSDDDLVEFVRLYKPRFNMERIKENLKVFSIMEPFSPMTVSS